MPNVCFDSSCDEWRLESGELLYVIAVETNGEVLQRYLGPASTYAGAVPHERRGFSLDSLPKPFEPHWELPARTAFAYRDTLLAAVFGPADRDLHLRYVSHEIDGATLRIALTDLYHPLEVDLVYEVADETSVIRRWAEVRNVGTVPVTLEQGGSLALYLAPRPYVLHHLCGAWADELNLVSEPLTAGRKVLESRRGFTSHQHQPWFAVEHPDTGVVTYGAIEWSGNWSLSFDTNHQGGVAVRGGMSDFDFAHVLEPGGRFETPPSIVGATAQGLDRAHRALREYIVDRVVPERPTGKTLPVIFEGWYTTKGVDITAERLLREAHLAADIGVELFIVTAGWYAKFVEGGGFVTRQGDWYPWPESFPNGLEEVADAVRGRGMQFGLWWEPETVGADSELVREHPDWVFQFDGRQPSQTPSDQLLLNLAHPDVYAHVRADIFRLVERYELDYFRTDMNQPWRELGDPSGRSGPGRDLAWRHLTNYYAILDELRAAYPALIIEGCASGGGRVDLGMLRRTHTTWISDNINQLVRLAMFFDGTSFLPQLVCENWMVARCREFDEPLMAGQDWAQPDIDFLFHVCMLGHLGVGADMTRWTPEWSQRAAHHIARYKELRETIQLGDLHRLTPTPPRNGKGDWAAAAMVARDKREAVAFCFRLESNQETFRLVVPGLDPQRDYEMEIDGRPGRERHRGGSIADRGIDVAVTETYASLLVILRRV